MYCQHEIIARKKRELKNNRYHKLIGARTVTCDCCAYLLTTLGERTHNNPLYANAIGMVIMQLPYVIIKVLLRYHWAS